MKRQASALARTAADANLNQTNAGAMRDQDPRAQGRALQRVGFEMSFGGDCGHSDFASAA
jgi:hypothetical protein